MEQNKPIDFKETAKRFTEKYYPQWLSRVDRIWEMLEKIDPNSLQVESGKSQYQLGNTFGIAGEMEPKLKECISGIAVFAFTCHGLKSDDEVAGPDLQSRITTTSLNMKISPGLQSKLEAVLSEMLPTIVGEAIKTEEEKLEINFTENKIKFDDTVDSRNKQQFKLLEYFINKDDHKVHWIESIWLFDEWRKTRTDISNLKKYFGVTISKLRGPKSGFFTENKLNLEINSLSNGFYKLNGIENYNSNILQTQSLYKEAFIAYQSNEFDEAKEKIVIAIDTYPEHIPSLELFVRLLSNVEIDSSFSIKAKWTLQREIAILEKSIETTDYYIKQLRKKEWCNDWNDEGAKQDFRNEIEIFKFKLNSELESLSECFENLKKWMEGKKISFNSDKKYEEIKGLIKEQDFNEMIKRGSVKAILTAISGILRRRKYSHLRALIKSRGKNLDKIDKFIREEAEDYLRLVLFDPEQSKRLDFSKALTLKELKSYLIKRAKFLIVGKLKYPELLDHDKRCLRYFDKIEEELQKKLGKKPAQEECFEVLKKEKKVGEEYCDYIKELIKKNESKLSYDEVDVITKKILNDHEDDSDNSI